MPAISVVIPTRNRLLPLQRALRSVENQTFRDFETIVVDDGSTDETAQYLASVKGPGFRPIVLSTSVGGGSARNKGIEKARGRFIAFLDDDDEWEATKLEEQMDALEQSKADLCHTGINCYRGDGRFRKYVYMKPAFHDPLKSMMNDNFLGGTSSILVSKTALERSGNFDPLLPALQDWDLYIRLMKTGCTVQGIDKPLVKYHVIDATKNVSLSFARYKKASAHLKTKYREYPFYSLFVRRIAIIEAKRYLKSRHFFLDAVSYYSNPRKTL